MSFDKLRTYIMEDEFEIKILNNKINISNYDSILDLEPNKIIISYKEGKIIIMGKKLYISKLLKKEILIEGIIKNIELGE